MKNSKFLLHKLLILVMFTLIFLASAPKSHAQNNQDWSTPVNLSSSGLATNPNMVVDVNGAIHVIWVDKISGYKYSGSNDGVTWTPPKEVEFPFEPDGRPPVLIPDRNGSIRVFWVTDDGGLLYSQSASADFSDPRKWTSPTRIGSDVLDFDVAFDARGILNVAFIRKSLTDSNPAGVYHRKSIVGGGSWSAPAPLFLSEYFRSASNSDAYIRISTSGEMENERIYITWDDRAQKRIYMTVSEDSGLTWGSVLQVKGPGDISGTGAPFNLTVAAYGDNVLLMWQVGEPSSSGCTIYSQFSIDGGRNWSEVTAVLGGPSECPMEIKIVDLSGEYVSVMLIGHVSPMLIAWNGERWSDVQEQTRLPPISNPLTFDTVMLGCRFDFIYNRTLYVVGCDQGDGQDVWFLSRSLEMVEDWFSPLSVWGVAHTLPVTSEGLHQISDFASVADDGGNVQVMWSKSSLSANGVLTSAIEISHWNGEQWAAPVSIFGSLNSMPMHLSMITDSLGRLLVLWVDGFSGDLAFSYTGLEKARLPSQWANITGLPSPSKLISSSDAVVDGSGRIIAVYAVPTNENRGIYLVQSIDNGRNWSIPVQVFDAISEEWERIDEPRIAVDRDGVLHLIFVRQTLRMGQPAGLYYSRSLSGGETWSTPQVLSTGGIQWAEIVSYDEKTVHVVWQEYDGLVYANLSQVSEDGGETWSRQINVGGVSSEPTRVTLASRGGGLLHFLQLMKKFETPALNQENLILQDWKWDNGSWSPDLPKDISITGGQVTYSLFANITSAGHLVVLLPVEYSEPGGINKSEILLFSRYLEGVDINHVLPAVLPTPSTEAADIDVSVVNPTATQDLSTLNTDRNSFSFARIIVGFVLIVVSVLIVVFVLIRQRTGNRDT